MSFSDGPHRCLERRWHCTRRGYSRSHVPPAGIRLLSEPTINWNPYIQGYELRGAVVACDPA